MLCYWSTGDIARQYTEWQWMNWGSLHMFDRICLQDLGWRERRVTVAWAAAAAVAAPLSARAGRRRSWEWPSARVYSHALFTVARSTWSKTEQCEQRRENHFKRNCKFNRHCIIRGQRCLSFCKFMVTFWFVMTAREPDSLGDDGAEREGVSKTTCSKCSC